jgi:hypothetical protein
MARCPFLDNWLPCTLPGTAGNAGSNGKVVRIVVHTVGVKTELEHVAQGSRAWWEKQVNENPGFKVSAHFTIERDGTIAQHVDTGAAAYGTGWLTTGSVHIEHAGNGQVQPLTDEQLHASATVMAWLAQEHSDIKLALSGTSLKDWGDPEKPGITTHRFIQLEYLKRFPGQTITPKPCPGEKVIGQLADLERMAKLYLATPKTAPAPVSP